MKSLKVSFLFLILLFSAGLLHAQSGKIAYDYDAAGNRIKRFVVPNSWLQDPTVILINGKYIKIWPNPLAPGDKLKIQVLNFIANEKYIWTINNNLSLMIQNGEIQNGLITELAQIAIPGPYTFWIQVPGFAPYSVNIVQQ